jgi:hypothetical protein
MASYSRMQESLREKEERVHFFEMYGILPEQLEAVD